MNIKKLLFEPLATKDEVYERLGPEMGEIVIEERRIVFYRYGIPIGAFIGSSLLFLLIYLSQYARVFYG